MSKETEGQILSPQPIFFWVWQQGQVSTLDNILPDISVGPGLRSWERQRGQALIFDNKQVMKALPPLILLLTAILTIL